MIEKIYASQDAATADLPKCPRPKGGQLDHWWYIDRERMETMMQAESVEIPAHGEDYIPCVCGTCGQKMNLSPDAEDYPV